MFFWLGFVLSVILSELAGQHAIYLFYFRGFISMLLILKCISCGSLLIVWLIMISRLESRILRLPCQKFADFSIERKGFMLQGHVIDQFNDVELHECYEYCMYDNRCKSINVEISEYGICQLNNASSHDSMDNVSLTSNVNWIFRSTNYSDLKVIISVLSLFHG